MPKAYAGEQLCVCYVPLSMNASVRGVEKIIGYKFKDPNLAWEALQAPGNGVKIAGNRKINHEGNKRMAMIGDAWLKLGILSVWHGASGRPTRADGDKQVQKYAMNDNLQRVCTLKGIDAFIYRNAAVINNPIAPRTLADTVEAIIGAVGLDGGLDAVMVVLKALSLRDV